MPENVKISKINKKRNEQLTKNKIKILKRLQMFYIFWTNVSKRKYIKCCDVKRMFKQRYL